MFIYDLESRLQPESAYAQRPAVAADILRNVPGLGRALEIVRHHNEHWDGAGYPDGLKGDAIPLGARIFSIANAFEAMTTGRPSTRPRPNTQLPGMKSVMLPLSSCGTLKSTRMRTRLPFTFTSAIVFLAICVHLP